MFTTPRLRDSISIALTKLLQRGRRGSHYIQVCKKGSRQSEQQRSDIQLRNLAFCVWEDASLWARCIHSFLMHFSYLGQSCFLVHLAPCILPTPQQSPEEWGEWQHPLPSEEWGVVWEHPLDRSLGSPHSQLEARYRWWLWHFCLLIWQEIFSFHKVKNTGPPKAWRNALGVVIRKEFKTRQELVKAISRSKFNPHPLK